MGSFNTFQERTVLRTIECKAENGQQGMAKIEIYDDPDPLALCHFEQLEGNPMSLNNFLDLGRLLQSITHVAASYQQYGGDMRELNMGVAAKHGNPCGAALGHAEASAVAYDILRGDPVAVSGGSVMVNFHIGLQEARMLRGHDRTNKVNLDTVFAPSFDQEAINVLARKSGKCRIVRNPNLAKLGIDSLDTNPRTLYARGATITQANYTFVMDMKHEEMRRYGQASPDQEADMLLAWAIGATSNSNTITLVKHDMLIGNGVGQQDRVMAAKLATIKAERGEHSLAGAVAYSDSFFPFPDGPQVLIDAGVKAILTTHGSEKDQLTIDLCQQHGIVLYMMPDSKARGFFGHS